jgi:hypothetical protein
MEPGPGEAIENLYDEKTHAEFYRNLEIVTGTTILPETRASVVPLRLRDAAEPIDGL